MEQIVQAYIQAKGLDENQAQQLIQELQQLDEKQLQQVIGNMQQQLQGNNQQEGMMQYGGSKKSWINSYGHKMEKTGENSFKIYSKPVKKSITKPQIIRQSDVEIRNNTTPTSKNDDFDSFTLPEVEIYITPEQKKYTSGQQAYELNDDYLYRLHQENTRGIKQTPKLIRNQYGGIPVSLNGVFEYPNQKVVVPNGNISMENVPYQIDAYDADSGEFLQTMQPNQNYQFNVDNILEVPKGRFGISKMQSGGNKSNLIFDDKTGVYTNPLTGEQFTNVNGNLIKLSTKVEGLSSIIIPNKNNFNILNKNSTVKADEKSRVVEIAKTPIEQLKNIPKEDRFGFVKDLSKVKDKSRKDNINDYKSWTEEWNQVIPNFKSLSYSEQQKQALDWIKKNQGKLDYKGVLGQLNSWGYKDSPDKLLTDGMFAEGTNLMRPSNLIGKEDPLPVVEDVTFSSTNKPSQSNVAEIPEVTLPKEERIGDNEEVNMDDVVLGKLNNKDYSGQYLSNMKLRNNTIKMPYFGRTDLKNPSLYTQNISPYLNELYAANNAAKQNLDMNSAVGQSAQIQLGANMLDRINDVSGKVYNTNMQQTVNWENALAGIYNQQQQYDDNNRRQYDDDVNRILANKQNVDNEIDRMAYEFKQTGVRNKNNLLLSQMLHPNYVIEEDGTMKRKGEKFNKGYNDYLEEEVKRLAQENEKLKTKIGKYGIRKK